MTNMIDLKEFSSKSIDSEFYLPLPKNYEIGKTKYIIVTGSVMSGIGKGTFTSCLGTLLKCHGFNITMLKFDGYLNYDAGTLNPYRHGEVFVLDDGTECDLDLGSYERFTNQNYSKENYLTSGKIFKTIIEKERRGEFLGRDVQFIPHVTGEIKMFLRNLANLSKADIVLVEVGGTVGDLENAYFLEALREMKYEEGNNICFINVTYIIEPNFLGEQKSKPAQLGIRKLHEIGIQPDIIVCRSNGEIKKSVKEKISLFSNVPFKRIFEIKNVDNVYKIPFYLKYQGIDNAIFEILGIQPKENKNDMTFEKWKSFANLFDKINKKITVAIAGKYVDVQDSYISIIKALEHTSPYYNAKPEIKWINSEGLELLSKEELENKLKEIFSDVDGLIIPGGFGKRGIEGKIACVKYARENDIPFLGICLGFQVALIEFARNVCGLKNANSTEFDLFTENPVVDLLEEQKRIEGLGGTMRLGGKDVEIIEGTLAYKLYKKRIVRERFRHRYECNPKYIKMFEDFGIVFSGKAPNSNIMQILEIPKNKFFIATQFHPEFTSKPLSPNPIFKGFVEECVKSEKK